MVKEADFWLLWELQKDHSTELVVILVNEMMVSRRRRELRMT